ncbi:restriction endonuclease subunit S [Methanococcoides orientis]|uniref:restriction endonuclease subunit S n=1 Tax=Methanococcoides orientis TaxID=2822137 RepID=UPI001E4CF29A|nr:restriction endonuclease subunit S [Methanococcoides orientis]
MKKAFEGELTREWREQQTNLPDAEDLLEQIRVEREESYKKKLEEWKRAVKEWEDAGKEGKKPSRPKKPKETKPLTINELSKLQITPQEWKWTKIGNLTLGVEYGTSAKSQKSGDVPVLRMGNIQNGKFDWGDLVFTSDKAEIEKYLLKKDDVLFNRTNSPELVGKTAIYKSERPSVFAGYLIRINQLQKYIVADFLNYFLNSHTAKMHGNSVKTDGVNQSNINGEKLSNYPFPLCSFLEQQAIVTEIETRLSVCDKVEQDIEENLERAEALRQSILKKAFEGKLLNERELEEARNAPDWEPAEVLLEQIKT